MNLGDNRAEQLKQLNEEIAALKESPLFQYRIDNNYLPVPGEGSDSATIMFIGEAPGEKEAKTGRPFVGRSGKFLDELLASINLPREEVFITSIVKDRPPKNRDPLPEEIKLYAPFLDRQIEIIKPEVIATLGRHSMAYIMERYGLEESLDTIGKLHGKVFSATTTGGHKFKFIPFYHPAVAIYNNKTKKELFEDFRVLKDFVKIKNPRR